MSTTKKKNVRKPKRKPLDTSNVVIVRHVTTPIRETEKLKKINKMLENAKLMD